MTHSLLLLLVSKTQFIETIRDHPSFLWVPRGIETRAIGGVFIRWKLWKFKAKTLLDIHGQTIRKDIAGWGIFQLHEFIFFYHSPHCLKLIFPCMNTFIICTSPAPHNHNFSKDKMCWCADKMSCSYPTYRCHTTVFPNDPIIAPCCKFVKTVFMKSVANLGRGSKSCLQIMVVSPVGTFVVEDR